MQLKTRLYSYLEITSLFIYNKAILKWTKNVILTDKLIRSIQFDRRSQFTGLYCLGNSFENFYTSFLTKCQIKWELIVLLWTKCRNLSRHFQIPRWKTQLLTHPITRNVNVENELIRWIKSIFGIWFMNLNSSNTNILK